MPAQTRNYDVVKAELLQAIDDASVTGETPVQRRNRLMREFHSEHNVSEEEIVALVPLHADHVIGILRGTTNDRYRK